MPTYEYRCSKGHHFELFQRMAEAPVDRCPQCDATAERVISSGGGLIFKGSGFYITDYRSDTYKKAAEADKAPSAGSGSADTSSPKESGTSSTSESKPAPKPSSSSGSSD
jgi:putative FmdB family regulatory protein